MQIKKCRILRQLIILIFIYFYTGLLFAQSKIFTQTLDWYADENAFEYKVEVQNISTKKSTFYETTETKITFSIEAGNYRYRVYAYDMLGRESGVSDWQNFKIIKARTPKINELEGNVIVSPAGKTVFSIPVEVSSITDETVAVLINEKAKKEIKGTLQIVIKGGEVVASFAQFPEVAEGEWKLRITNPSGLYSETEKIEITKTLDKAVSMVNKNPTVLRLTNADRMELSRRELERKQQENQIAAEKERREAELALEKQLEAERKAEENRLAEEKRKEEELKLAEEKMLAEEQKLAAEKEAEEQKRLAAEEKRIAEEKKAEEKARIAEEKRLAAEERRKNYKYKDIQLMAGPTALFNIYDGKLFEYSEHKAVPTLKAGLSYYPIDLKTGKLGLEAETNGYKLYKESDLLNFEISALSVNLDLVYHLKLPADGIFIGLKSGPQMLLLETDVSYLNSAETRANPENQVYGYLGVDGGVSLFVNPVKCFVAELGVDFTHTFITNAPTGSIEFYFTIGGRL